MNRRTLRGLADQWLEIADKPHRFTDCPALSTIETPRQAAWCCTNSDACCAELILAAQRGDAIAGLCLLVALWPRLVKLARRDKKHTIDDYLANAWVRIMTFPSSRMRSRLLANLALDCLKSLSRSWARQHRELPLPFFEPTSLHPPESPDTAAIIQEGVRLRLVSQETAGVLTSVYLDGLSGREAAAKHKMSETAVRYRCSYGTKKLRSRAQELLRVA